MIRHRKMKQNYKLIPTLVFSLIPVGNCYAFGYCLWGRHVIIDCWAELGCITHRTQLPHREGLDGWVLCHWMPGCHYLITHPLSFLPYCLYVWCWYQNIIAHHLGYCPKSMSEDKSVWEISRGWDSLFNVCICDAVQRS